MKTILITGASTGIGKEAAIYFANNDWNVAATMRTPEKEKELLKYSNIKLFRLDVMDEQSIRNALDEAIQIFGSIDVLYNNAGYGLIGPFEAMTQEQIKRQFETNVFGVMNVTRAILPHFREKRNGTIITTSSMAGKITFPLYSPYHGTKWAVEGFMESLRYELKPFNIRIKLIEPGVIKTDFYDRSMDIAEKKDLTAYNHYVNVVINNIKQLSQTAPGASVIVKKIMQAATDKTSRLRYPVGNNAPLFIFLGWLLPLKWFTAIVRSQVEKGMKSQIN